MISWQRRLDPSVPGGEFLVFQALGSRFAHFFRSSQNLNTLNSWGLYDYPILEES